MENQILEFEDWLIARSSDSSFRDYKLYKLLASYYKMRCDSDELKQELLIRNSNVSDGVAKVWSHKNFTFKFDGECGDNKRVFKEIKNRIAHFEQEEMNAVSKQLTDNQKNLKQLLSDVLEAEMMKSKIDYCVREIISYSCFQSTQVTQIRCEDYYLQCIQDLRLSVSILFCHLRKPIQNKDFIENVRSWLLQLTALQSQFKTLEDHWFLLFHLLRCPNKLSWASSMIQVPCSSFEEYQQFGSYLCLSMLRMIVSPIRKRKEFLKEYHEAHRVVFESNPNSPWIFVESDGEEADTPLGDYNNLSEYNLIVLLNQIPLETLFRSMLCSSIADDTTIGEVTEKHLMKIIEFNSLMIETLSAGLKFYNSEKYKHFIKRIGLLIKHCIHYTSDYYSLIIKQNLDRSQNLNEKIRIKFDDFLVLACARLYNSQNTGVLQFFQYIPYHSIHQTTLYALFYYLNVGFPENPINIQDYRRLTCKTKLLEELNWKIQDKAEEDVHFLLQIFFEMAMSREKNSDWAFIQIVSKQIFYIGYVNEKTNELYFKSCKDILCSLTKIYPELISDLLILTHNHKPAIKYAEDIFNCLPIYVWKPNISCLAILSEWLLEYSYEKEQNLLAREIFNRMNWDFTRENDLFLHRDIHMYTACIISEAVMTFSSESLSLEKKPVLLMNNENFIDWCWRLLLRLHLHYLDQASPIPEMMLKYRPYYLVNIPDLPEVEILMQGVKESCLVAMYLSIQVTLWGHSIPLICQKGFEIVDLLLLKNKVIVALKCLEMITIFFTEYPEILLKCTRFQKIISKLIQGESMKTMLNCSTLELFRNMIQSQITRFKEYGFSSPKSITFLWLKSLIHLAGSSEKCNVICLLDAILINIHHFPTVWMEGKKYIQSEYRLFQQKFKKTRNKESTQEYMWYTMVVLNIEHELLEIKTNLWYALISQLENDENVNFDVAFKAAVLNSGSDYIVVNDLVIFKYAEAIVNISHKHYLLAVIIQEFFKLFYCSSQNLKSNQNTRVPINIYNRHPSLMDRVLNQMKSAETYYRNQCRNFGELKSDISLELNKKLWRFFQDATHLFSAISLRRKFGNTITVVSIPCYSINLTDKNWTELLDTYQIVKEIDDHVDSWMACCFRRSTTQHLLKQSPAKLAIDPIKRIQCYLQSYEVPQRPQDFNMFIISRITSENTSEIFRDIINLTVKLKKQSIVLSRLLNKLSILDNEYKYFLSKLYNLTTYDEIHRVKCSVGLVSAFYECSKPADIVVKIGNSTVDLKIKDQMEANRINFDQILNRILSEILPPTVEITGKLQFTVKNITEYFSKSCKYFEENGHFFDLCKMIFFEFIESCDENVDAYLPTISVMRNLIRTLGICVQNYLQVEEGCRIIKAALKYTSISYILYDIIEPLNTNFECFIQMYATLIESEVNSYNSSIVFLLISKFDLRCCLQYFRPDSTETGRLISLIFSALNKCNEEKYLMKIYRQQLIEIFQFEFPSYNKEFMQLLITFCRKKQIRPIILSDIINSLLEIKFDEKVDDDIFKIIQKFATNQKALKLDSILVTVALLTEQFHKARIENRMHGIYPIYEEYCEYLAILFAYFGQLAISTAKISFSPASTEFSKKVLMPLFSMYNPWTCVYTVIEMSACKSNRMINDIDNETLFHAWSEPHSQNAKMIVNSLAAVIKYSASIDKINRIVMANAFDWYVSNFADRKIPSHIRALICNVMIDLPWDCYYPLTHELVKSNQILIEDVEENIVFLGNVFLKISWREWFYQIFLNCDVDTQDKFMHTILAIVFKIYFQTSFHASISKLKISTAILMLPWERTSYNNIENIFYLMETTESSFAVHLLSAESETDVILWSLVKNSCAMSSVYDGKNTFNIRSKRLLFVRRIISLTKKIFSEMDENLFQKNSNTLKSLIFDVMETIGTILIKHNEGSCETNMEAVILLLEIINSSTGQNDYISAFLVQSLISWQTNQNINQNILILFLESIAMKSSFDVDVFNILESTIDQYFKHKVSRMSHLDIGWKLLMGKLCNSLGKMDLQTVIVGDNLLVAHLLLKHNMHNKDEKSRDLFLSKMMLMLEKIKIRQELEPKLAILWGGLISGCIENSFPSKENRQELIQMASYMNSIATDAECWSSKLFGIIGFSFSFTTPKFSILSRCLAAIIYFACNKRILFLKTLAELKSCANVKTNSEISLLAIECIKMIESSESTLESITSRTFSIIQTIYNDPIVIASKYLWEAFEH